jgi:hypothetical protein
MCGALEFKTPVSFSWTMWRYVRKREEEKGCAITPNIARVVFGKRVARRGP